MPTLAIYSSSWKGHLDKLDAVLTQLSEAGLKVNTCKCFFGTAEVEYLGYMITRNGIKPMTKKVNAIQQIAISKTRKELRKLIGMINYCHDMWIRRSHVLAPLTELTSDANPWKWTEQHTNAFNAMKHAISRQQWNGVTVNGSTN